MAQAIPSPVTAAVVTGGHPYDVVPFHRLFRGLPDADVYIQHMDDFASSPPQVRRGYDVVVFYHMLMDGPSDEAGPGYAGRPRTALEALGDGPQGILVLHHAILAYPKWPAWSRLVGIRDRTFGYWPGRRLRVRVARQDHPITAGLADWDMPDETYTMAEPGRGCRVLLATEHPKSMKAIAWTRRHKRARVFCLQSGHDDATWTNPNFREVLRRGLLWCARRI